MSIRVDCHKCGKTLIAPDEYAGRSTICPACKSTLTILPPSINEGGIPSRLSILTAALIGVAVGFVCGIIVTGQFREAHSVQALEQPTEQPIAEQRPTPLAAPTRPTSLADLVRLEKGIDSSPAPEDWRIVEGRILGIGSGLAPRFRYLRGSYSMGLAREDVIEPLKKEFPGLYIEDESNGATGELIVAHLTPYSQVALYGSWQNVHAVLVTMSCPSSSLTERQQSEFIITSDIVAALASGNRGYANGIDKAWIKQALAKAKQSENGVERIEDEIEFSVSFHLLDWEESQQYASFWFMVRAVNGPIGARTARGETTD